MFASPSVYSCIGIEVGSAALGTIITHEEVRDRVWDLDVFAGVMATRADNHEIELVTDLKDKIIGAGAIDQLMGGQLQFYEMEKEGLSFVNDPKQVVFAGDQAEVVRGVLRGDFDVGFVRTDQIERTSDEDGNLLDPELFKILSPKVHLMDNGDYFPFLHTTEIFPEWPFAMLDHIPQDVAHEVEEALRAISRHARVGRRYHDCLTTSANPALCDQMDFPFDVDPDARCDTTKAIADLAKRATKDGHFYGFRPPRSYFQLRSMQQDGGFLAQDENEEWHCIRPSSFYEGIRCPVGYFKRSHDEFEKGCEHSGLTCKEEHDCFCNPCVKSHEVDVYKHIEGAEDKHLQNYFGEERLGCEKMDVCAHVEQTKTIIMRLFDNMHRADPTVRVLVHAGDFSKEIPVTRIPGTSGYQFSLSEKRVQAQVLEIFFDGEQIPESPIRIIVDDLDCDAQTHENSHRSADVDGNCVCSDNTYEMFGECIESAYFFLIIFSCVFIGMVLFVWLYLRYKKHQNDSVWHINVDELHFNEPPEVIGQGGFGVVILGQYRGTKVAVKRVLPPKESRMGSTKRGSVIGNPMSQGVAPVSGTADLSQSVSGNGTRAVGFEDGGSDDDIECGGRSKSISSKSWERNFVDVKNFGNPLKVIESATLSNHGSSEGVRASRSFTDSSVQFITRLLPEALRFDEHTKAKRDFVVEMRLLSRLRHPCITTVMGAVISSATDPMLVMEYMEYGSLYDLLHNETMDAGGDILLQITRDIVQGLQFLHASKPPILHGDLKAKNILVDSRFRAKVADFGFSHTKRANISSVLRGTPFYMAPEYLRRTSEYTTQCDIYSFSMILYEMYARKEPFEGQEPRKLLPKICHPRTNKRPPVPEAMPERMSEIMKKCWAANPFFRPSAKDLDHILVECSPRDAEPTTKAQNAFKDGMKRKPTSLYDVFPKHIADALNAGKKVEAESHEIVTVVFSDIVGFTKISQTFSPLKVSNMLDRLYHAFDDLTKKHKIFKVETIGDAYMGVTNLDGSQFDDHVKQAAEFAMEAVEAASEVLIDDDSPERGCVQIRVGFHSGPVVSNVIGSLNPRYGLFGDTVNTASRMESNSEANKILCSHASAELLKTQAPGLAMKLRGKIKVKGKGAMMTYWIGNTNYRPALVPIMDVSEASDEESELTMDAANPPLGGHLASNNNGFDESSFGTRETDELISLTASERSPVRKNPAEARHRSQLGRISDILRESLKELVASRKGYPVEVTQEEKEEIKRLEDKIGRGPVLEEVVDCIPFDKVDDHQHRDTQGIVLGKDVEKQISQLVEAVAGMYNDNGFHGILHAMHVLSSAKAMLSRITYDAADDNSSADTSFGLAEDKLARFAMIFSALIHDIDHRGVPNFCLAKEDPKLASRYVGKAIAEQNSIDIGWEMLMAPKYKELRQCIYTSKEELMRFRKLVVNIVIATDIFVSFLEALRTDGRLRFLLLGISAYSNLPFSSFQDPDLSKRREDRWQRSFDPNHWSKSFAAHVSTETDANLKATVVLELLMQASDIAHTMQHWNVYTNWNEKLFTEMYNAYKDGRFPKDPSESWYEGELNFFDDKVIPLARELQDCGVFGNFSNEYLQLALENREHWEARGKTVVQNYLRKLNGETDVVKEPMLHKIGVTGKNVIQSVGKEINQVGKGINHMGKTVVRTVIPKI